MVSRPASNTPLGTPAITLAPRTLRFGYVPLTDAAPLLVADALGLFANAGVRVALSREAAWAAVRDKLAFGALDAAHLLGPVAIALAAGAGGFRRSLTVTAGLARNGNTITLSHALASQIGAFEAPLEPSLFAAALHRRAEDGLPPPTLAVVFPHSSHNYLLRHWLAAGGLDPDHDVRLVVVPPPQMARALAEGAIEGFCAGEPWGSQAIAAGAGRFALASGDIWPDHPEKVLAFGEAAAQRDRDAMIAATAAVIEAARWLDEPANRNAAVALLQERAFPGLAPATIAAALAGTVAAAPGGAPRRLAAPMRFAAASCPRAEEAGWWFDAMRRWGHLGPEASRHAALAPWRADLWHAAAARLDPPPFIGRAATSPPQPTFQEPDA
ncbi:ABC transporter substrate-binding protein [Roseomonas eburnea]|uniref:ABC transporter substrate-binding protein n=1 Tax=Neoroseomonas eburnea TaxID=1346889 RepID=A0A9X9XB12_9PROT|nr:ABC transporter substrate-binding protein [Neoroseomonas eburnea]